MFSYQGLYLSNMTEEEKTEKKTWNPRLCYHVKFQLEKICITVGEVLCWAWSCFTKMAWTSLAWLCPAIYSLAFFFSVLFFSFLIPMWHPTLLKCTGLKLAYPLGFRLLFLARSLHLSLFMSWCIHLGLASCGLPTMILAFKMWHALIPWETRRDGREFVE